MKRKPANKIVKDDVVLCDKKAAKGLVTIWVIAEPKIRAQARDLAEAEELLVDKIWDICELDEPFAIKYKEAELPEAAQEDKVFWVSSNGLIDTGNPSEYFKGGFCSACQKGVGERNDVSLKLEKVPKAVKSGFMVRFKGTRGCMMRKLADIIHKDICRKINETSQPLVEFRQVIDVKRGPTDFYEVIPTRNFSGVTPLGKIDPGGKCPDCGSVHLYNDVGKAFLTKRDADIIRRHGVAAIGSFAPYFCVSSRVWNALKKVEAAKRLLKLHPFIELEEKDIEPNPVFEKYQAWP
jgi:hypothetical protein